MMNSLQIFREPIESHLLIVERFKDEARLFNEKRRIYQRVIEDMHLFLGVGISNYNIGLAQLALLQSDKRMVLFRR